MIHPNLPFLTALALTALPFSNASSDSAAEACEEISTKVSSASDVIHAQVHLDFIPDIHHWYISSSQNPECVFEPGSIDDLATAMKVIGSTRSPFAIKSGGHASNPGFSSTTGVHISLKRMDQVTLSDDNSTVEIGTGITWADVYERLQDTGYNVVGGRTVGPGVGGFTLGGKPTNTNGTVTRVNSEQPDLFFALKGGLNRFGIVASAEFYTHEQSPEIYGGLAIYGKDEVDSVLNATAKFDAENTDPKAQLITTLEGSELGTRALVLFFYDGPDRPESFSHFDDIDSVLDLTKTQTFADFVKGFQSNLITNARGTFHTLSTSKLTPKFLAAVKNETDSLGGISASHSGYSISYDIEPFVKTWGDNATDSAYPHADSPLPLNLYFAWISEDDDEFWYDAMRSSIQNLKKVAIEEGIHPSDFTAYPNYAISNTTAEELYGSKNAARLSAIRSQTDPDGVMQLTGGFSI
ncbi:hypothetical protein SLS57_007904 [Botryosphaeria dothidea]